MLFNTILVPLSAILAVVSAMPAKTSSPADFDEGQIIDLNSWAPQSASDVSEVSPRSDLVFKRDLGLVTCSNGKKGNPAGIAQWFEEAKAREICIKNGDVVTWSRGNNRFKAVNRSGAQRCSKFLKFKIIIEQLSEMGLIHCGGKSTWGIDRNVEGQTFALWSV